MGANASRRPSLPFNPSDYEQVRPKSDSEEPPSYRVLKHIRTGIEMQEYRLQFNDEHEFNDFYDAFEWRQQQQYVVNTCYLVETHRKEFCSTHYGAVLYTERIPIKLSQIKDIPYPDNLYILYAALEGFHTVYHKTGFFEVQEHMVCINKQGKVKVWINDNLSRKFPQSIYTQTDGSEEDIVRRIIQLIEYNTDGASQPISVQEYIRKHISRPSFGDAKMLLRQYAKEHGVGIPRSFECILEVLNSDYNRTEITDSGVEEFRTYNGKGSRHAPSVRSQGRNNIKTRSRRSDKYSRGDSQSHNNSFHDADLPKHSNRNGRGDVLNSRVNITRSSQIMQHQRPLPPHFPPHLTQSRLQQNHQNLIPLQAHSPNLRNTNYIIKGPLPVITEGGRIIQHMHHPVGPQGFVITNGAPASQSPMLFESVRPAFYPPSQQAEIIISTTPSHEQIHYINHNEAPRNSISKERRLNIYSESDDSQLKIQQGAEVQGGQHRTYPQIPVVPIRVPMVMHHYSIGQPYQQPHINNNVIRNSDHQQHHSQQQQYHPIHHNIYDQEESIRSSHKQRSLSRSKKYNSDAQHSRSMSRKHKRKPRDMDSSDQSQTEEEYEQDRRQNRKKQQQGNYRKQQPVIDEDEDDDDEEQRIRRSRRQRRYRQDHAKLKMYRDRQEQQYRRQKEQEEYRRRREQDEFRRKRDQEEFRTRMQLEEQQHRERKAQQDFQRRAAFEEETRKQREREEQYLRQKHREEIEYHSRPRDHPTARLPSDASSLHDRTRNSYHFQHDVASRSSNHITMQAGRRLDEASFRNRQPQAFMYYSSDQDHQLDPDIARDLMVMQL